MAYNRFVLNATSYHGKGAIQAIPEIIKAKGFVKIPTNSMTGIMGMGAFSHVGTSGQKMSFQ